MRRPAALLRWTVVAAAALPGALPPPPAAAAPPAGTSFDPRDRLLYERALRIGSIVATRHTTPEGLLAHDHERGAGPERLSAVAVTKGDTGIWSGCYAASLACRYAVTHDPAALSEARRLAAGLDLLSRATGVEGGICRSVGRWPEGPPPPDSVVPSPLGGGLWFHKDPSRDTLSGVVLGWECLAKFVDDPEVHAFAVANLRAIAKRLWAGGMKIRDPDGRVTTFGDLEPSLALGLVHVGEHAAIGCAAILAGASWSDDPDLWAAWKRLDSRGWVDALADQNIVLGAFGNVTSNWNMVHLALLTVLLETKGKPARKAMSALHDFRRATRGWQNGGYISCALLSGMGVYRDEMVEELRGTLLAMPPWDGPFLGSSWVRRDHVVPIEKRWLDTWMWKQNQTHEEVGREGAVLDPKRTYTRADFLFAYWLARAAGELDPGPDPAAAPR